jgi:hypothetical protein
MKLKDIILTSLLGACGGVAILSTNLFHALIPIPGFGGLFFIPFSIACVIIARWKIDHFAAATATKLVQQVIILLIPGGPPLTKNPLLIPLLIIDGILIDLFYKIRPFKIPEHPYYTGLLTAICASASLVMQTLVILYLLNQQPMYIKGGLKIFLAIFIGLHGLLRFIGGFVGSYILKSIPERTV